MPRDAFPDETVTLTSAVIRGSSVYTPAELFPAYSSELGKPLTSASVRAIAANVAKLYRVRGYAEPRVTVDTALAAHGVVRIDIAEARLAEVSISGHAGPYRARLERLEAELEQAAAVLSETDLRIALDRLRTLPGLTVAASAARDTAEPNLYTLALDADFSPIAGAVRVTNRGTDEIGPLFVLGQVVANGLFGSSSSAGVSFAAADDEDEYRAAGILGSGAIGSRTKVIGNGFSSRADPRERSGDRDDVYRRDRLTLRAERRLGNAGALELALTGALEWDDLTAKSSGVLVRDERLRTLGAGARLGWRAGDTRSSLVLDAVKGLDGLGSRLTALDLAHDPRTTDFLLLKLAYTRAMRLDERWSVRLDAFAQQSSDVLPFVQRFKIGGDRLGRGFEVARIAGDSGIGAKAELRRRLPAAPPFLPAAAVYGFYDLAAAWRNDVPGRDSAATAGLGLASDGRRVSTRLELAAPLTRPDVDGRKKASLFLELTTRF